MPTPTTKVPKSGLPATYRPAAPQLPATYKQPSTLYKTPTKPGFLGGYNWHSLGIGLFMLFASNVAATQYVAWMFSYQPGLGPPLLRVGSFALYQPFAWAVWILRFGGASSPKTRFAILLGALVICLGIVVTLGIVYLQNMRRARALSEGTSDLHGSARWANRQDMLDAGILNQPDGVYIGGWYDQQRQAIDYLRHNGPEHVLAFAPTRSGKGVGLVIPTLLGWNESAVVYDIKGENWEKTAGYRTAMGHLCLQFSPVDATGRGSRFNPLKEVRVGTEWDVSDAQNMADILVRNVESRPTDTHWIDTAAMVVTAVILHVCYKALAEGREANLGDLASTFGIHGQNFRDTLTEMTLFDHDPDGKYEWTLPDGRATRVHPVVLEHVQKMQDKADKEFSSVVSTVNTAFQIYSDPLVRRNTIASDFTVNDLVNFHQPVSLYIVVPPSDRVRLAPLLRLVFTLIANRLTQRMAFDGGEQIRNRHRLLLLIDEFPTLRKMEVFADALSYMGGYGIKCYLIAQDIQQIIEHYGVHESIVSNCHIRIAFAPNKFETAELLSKMTGTITIEKASLSFSGSRVAPVLDHITQSVQQIERPLMTPDEVLRIQPPKKISDGHTERIVAPGEMLIFVSGHPPILGTQILYFLDPAFAQHVTIRPPLRLLAIEEGVALPQRALDRTRHRLSRPERNRPEDERERQPAAPNNGQAPPPPPSFHDELAIAQNPHYQPYVGPPAAARESDEHLTQQL